MSEIITVQPRNVAVFRAMRWDGDEASPHLLAMAEQYGWRFESRVVKGTRPFLRVIGRNGRSFLLHKGEWILALGTSGAFRVLSDRQFRADYEQVIGAPRGPESPAKPPPPSTTRKPR